MLELAAVERPKDASEAVRALTEREGRGLYVAGGTIVVPAGSPNLDYLVDLTAAGLSGLRRDENGAVVIGATTRVADLARSEEAGTLAGGLLRDAALAVANHTVRNLATVGGNLASWHFPTDLPPALLALDAEIVLRNTKGERRVSLEDFYAKRAEVRRKGDLIVEVAVPDDARGFSGAFEKSGRTRLDVATVNCAAALAMDGDVLGSARIALNGVSAFPLRAREAEAALEGGAPDEAAFEEAARAVSETLAPQSDHRASADYRRKLARVLVGRALRRAAGLSETRGSR